MQSHQPQPVDNSITSAADSNSEALQPTAAHQASAAPHQPSRFLLDNGLCVITQEVPSAGLVSAQLWVKTGSIHEGELLGCGLSHYLEHMLFKGTARRGALDISAEVNALGGYINAYTTYDRTVYYIDAPAEHTAEVLDILLDMGLHASLPEEEIERERDVILREIDMGLDDPDRTLMEAFIRTAFREHPCRQPIIGWRELFSSVSAADLRSYYHARYSPDNMVLVLAGSFDSTGILAQVQSLAAGEPRHRHSSVSLTAEPSQLSRRHLRLEGDSPLVRGMSGYRIPGLADADAPALDIIARLLGGGQSSLLWQRLRERDELVHHISAGCWNPGEQGLLWINYTCDAGKRDAVEAAIAEEILRLHTSLPTLDAVSKAVRQSLVADLDSRRTVNGIASRLGAAEVVLGDLDYPARYLELLRAITPEQISETARRHLQPHLQTAVSLEPRSTKNDLALAKKSASASAQWPAFEETVFPNGARLLLQPSEGGKVHLRFGALGGPLWESEGCRGATGVLASLLTRDTAHRSSAQIAEAIESVGGSFNEFVGNNTFGFSIEVLSEDFPLAADLLTGALLHRKSTKKSFAIERDSQLASLLEDEDEPLDWARRRLRQQFFADHPYATDYLGTEADLAALMLADVNTLAETLLCGRNTVLAVSGNFDPQTVHDTLAPVLSALPNSAFNIPPNSIAPTAAAHNARLQLEREQAIVLVGFPDAGTRQAEAFLLGEMLDEIFSGMASPLFRRVREEQGLAYYVGSERISGIDCGLFTFYAGTHASHADHVLREIESEIARAVNGGLTMQELEQARLRLRVRQRQSQQLPGSRAMQAVLCALYGKGANHWMQQDAALDAVSLDALHSYAQKHFDAHHRQTLIVTA